jgi:hypothetical protein
VMMSVTTSAKMRATEKTKNFSNKTKCWNLGWPRASFILPVLLSPEK